MKKLTTTIVTDFYNVVESEVMGKKERENGIRKKNKW